MTSNKYSNKDRIKDRIKDSIKDRNKDIHPESDIYKLNTFHLLTFGLWFYFVLKYILQRDLTKLFIPTFLIATTFYFVNMYRSIAPVSNMNKLCCRLSIFESFPWFKQFIGMNTPFRDMVLSNLSSITFSILFISVLFVIGSKLKGLFSAFEWSCFTHILMMVFFVTLFTEGMRWWKWNPIDGESNDIHGMVSLLHNGMYGTLSFSMLSIIALLSRHVYEFIELIITRQASSSKKTRIAKSMNCTYNKIYGELRHLLYFFLFPLLLVMAGSSFYFIGWQMLGHIIHSLYGNPNMKKNGVSQSLNENTGTLQVLLIRLAHHWESWNSTRTTSPNVCILTILLNIIGLYVYFVFDKYAYDD